MNQAQARAVARLDQIIAGWEATLHRWATSKVKPMAPTDPLYVQSAASLQKARDARAELLALN